MKKLGILTLFLLVSLAVLGLGYARWSEMLYINGTVDTGKVDWCLTEFSIQDDYAPPPIYPTPKPDYNSRDGFAGPIPRFWLVNKNVGWGEGELVDTDGDGDNDTLELTLNNVYPSYWNEVAVYAQNCGTVPIIIDRVLINGTVLRKPPTPVVKLDVTGDGKEDIEIWWRNAFGVQLEPGDDSPEMSFWFHVLQAAPEGASLNFSICIEAVQWNEYVAP